MLNYRNNQLNYNINKLFMRKMSLRFFAYLILFLSFWGCRNEMDSYYERPKYLRGNAYAYLQEKGNYTYFLQALEMTNYSDALDGRGLYSVFAPDDEAFKRYLAKKGKSSLQEMDKDSLKLLVSYHLIEFSFNRQDFLAFSKTASAEEPIVGDGSCYKFETLAQEGISLTKNPITEDEKKVYHQKKFLPVLSTRLFDTQGSTDYAGDYKMFFPDIQWQGDQDHLYVANAAVLESGIPLDNGYMYLVDEVIDLLPTVYHALEENNNYRIFKDLYNRFVNFQYDADKTKNYAELGDSIFMFYHYLAPNAGDDLPDLACEWTVQENEADYEARLKYAYNCFAPSNDVLNTYINSFWEGKYNYQDVPLLSMYYLLKAHCANRQTLILPSKIDKGIEGYYGEKWELERKNIEVSKFCSNGVLYGIDRILEPAMFTMVMQPFFKYDRFNTMLNIAHKQETFITMVDPDREFTIFAVDNGALKEKYGYYADLNGNPTNSDPLDGRVVIKRFINETNQSLTDMNDGEQKAFITNQVIDGIVHYGYQYTGRKYYATKNQYHYIYTENGDIYGENQVSMDPLNTWTYEYENGSGSGVVYEMPDKFGAEKDGIGMHLFRNSAKYQKFYEALLNADLLKLLPEGATTAAEVKDVELAWLKGERTLVFAPTNDAWDETIVPVDSTEKSNFLKYFFIPVKENKMNEYVLPNLGTPGLYDTRYAYSPVVKAKMRIDFVDDKRLRLSNEAGNSVLTDSDVPFFATDGVIFGITKVITAEK